MTHFGSTRRRPKRWLAFALGLALVGPRPLLAATAAQRAPHVLWSAPFVLLLLAIAILPLVPLARHWWERHHVKLLVGLALGAIVLAYYGLRGHGFQGEEPGAATVLAVLRQAVLKDYAPFLALMFSLYVISGGLQVRGDLRARPSINTGLLALGAVLASLIGTTGASMVLIRPLLQTNRDREHVKHTVVFFIFLVSNVGGCLLPIGDPPLFLGYLQGVPFFWTLTLVRPWLFCVGVLLSLYFTWDQILFRRESQAHVAADARHYSPLRLHGTINLVWLLGVILTVALIVPGRPLPGIGLVVPEFVREAILLGLTALSLATTPHGLRKETEFSYEAIVEVGYLFLGIFLTVQVPIEILEAQGASLGLTSPRQFFWAAGGLSGFLDNAPTYLVFLETAKTLPSTAGALVVGLVHGSVRHDLLAAISLGSVFMGANTYIGNGPNFMVRAIAERHGVPMPSFFGYMLYSGAVLIPLYVLVSILFLA